MNLTIHARAEEDGLHQIATVWSFYEDETIETPIATHTVTEPDNILILNPNLFIPTNTTYWITADRVCHSLDGEGNPITHEVDDGQGNITTEVLEITINATKRTPFKNDGILQSANIFELPIPEIPLLSFVEEDNGDFSITSSKILPEILPMNSIEWGVYEEDMTLIDAQTTSGGEILNITVPVESFKGNNKIVVTAIHMSAGIASPIAKMTIDVNQRIRPTSNIRNVVPTIDYLLNYTENLDDYVITDISFFNKDLGQKVSSLDAINSSIVLESSLLQPGTTYEVVFSLQDPKDTSVVDVESIEFFTMSVMDKFFEDIFFVYQDNTKLVSSTTINQLSGYVEKTFDGRFPYLVGGLLTWGTMENGVVGALDGFSIADNVVGKSSHINMVDQKFLSIFEDTSVEQVKIILNRDEYNQKRITQVWETTIGNSSNVLNYSYAKNIKTLFYPTDTGLKKMVFDDETMPTEMNMPTRPDQVVVGTKFISNTKDVVVMGGSENIYVYNEATNRYMFLTIMPPEFVGIEIQPIIMTNNDILIVPINEELPKVAVLDFKTKNIEVKEMETPMMNIKGILKSNGVIFLHNGTNQGGYYV